MADEPLVKCCARVLGAPAFLCGDEANPQRHQIRICRIGCTSGKGNFVAPRPAFDVAPEVIHLYRILGEAGVVLLNQYLAQVERAPSDIDTRCGCERLNAHDRQISMDTCIEEKKVEAARHDLFPVWTAELGPHLHLYGNARTSCRHTILDRTFAHLVAATPPVLLDTSQRPLEKTRDRSFWTACRA